MATRYARIGTGMWDQEAFARLSPAAKLVDIALDTGPHTTALPGLWRCSEGALLDQTRLPYATLRRALREVERAGRVLVDRERRLVRRPCVGQEHAPVNPNQVTAWRAQWLELPDCPMRADHVATLRALCEGIAWAEAAWTATFGAAGFPWHAPVEAPAAATYETEDAGNRCVNGSTNRCPNRSTNGSDNGSANRSANGSGEDRAGVNPGPPFEVGTNPRERGDSRDAPQGDARVHTSADASVREEAPVDARTDALPLDADEVVQCLVTGASGVMILHVPQAHRAVAGLLRVRGYGVGRARAFGAWLAAQADQRLRSLQYLAGRVTPEGYSCGPLGIALEHFERAQAPGGGSATSNGALRRLLEAEDQRWDAIEREARERRGREVAHG